MNNEKDLGLRERKRIETRREIERAAVELVLANGLDETTIEAISQAAEVSPRTFFNYFDSKEEAVLGLHDISLDKDYIDRHIKTHSGMSVIESTIALLVAIVSTSLNDPKLYKSRIQIVRQYPKLLEGKMDRMMHMKQNMLSAVEQIAAASTNSQDNHSQAHIVMALCTSSIRISIKELMMAGRKISPQKLQQNSLQKINEVISTFNDK